MRTTCALLLIILLAGCGGNSIEPTAISAGQFNVNVSGAVLSTFSGSGFYTVSESEEVADTTTVFLGSADNAQIVNISFPVEPAVGTYAIDPSTENATSPIISFAQITTEGEITVYNGMSGEVILDSVNPMTGSFQFTGQNINGEEVGVNGTFNGLSRGEPPTPEASVDEPTE